MEVDPHYNLHNDLENIMLIQTKSSIEYHKLVPYQTLLHTIGFVAFWYGALLIFITILMLAFIDINWTRVGLSFGCALLMLLIVVPITIKLDSYIEKLRNSIFQGNEEFILTDTVEN